VRDLGTLKALGWPTRRIVAQIIGESAVTGACGALAGIVLGFASAAVLDAISPKLTAAAAHIGSSAAVRLTAHVGTSTALSAALLAVGCALVAGALGGWRAARLQPADAFTEVT
jgi:putative ABC transport system permease protein